MVKKSNFLWFDKKILVLLIAFYVQNVTSFWGKLIFFKKIRKFSRKKILALTQTQETTRGSLKVRAKIFNCITKS